MSAARSRRALRSLPGSQGAAVASEGKWLGLLGGSRGQGKVHRYVCSPLISELSLTDEHCTSSKINVVPSDIESLRDPGSGCEHELGKTPAVSGLSAWRLKALIHSNVTGFLILVSTLNRFILSGWQSCSSAQWLMTPESARSLDGCGCCSWHSDISRYQPDGSSRH
jgi:hypothetical protein